jgi:hypothetical protein
VRGPCLTAVLYWWSGQGLMQGHPSAAVFQEALKAGFAAGDDYYQLWLAYIAYERRRLDWAQGMVAPRDVRRREGGRLTGWIPVCHRSGRDWGADGAAAGNDADGH